MSTPIFCDRRTNQVASGPLKKRSGQSHDHAADEFGPGLRDIGIVGHIADGHRHDAVVRQRQIDAVAGIEIDQIPESAKSRISTSCTSCSRISSARAGPTAG
jgi:hypothetical protein